MIKADGTKETPREVQERVANLKFIRRKAIRSVGHPAFAQRFRPVLSWDDEKESGKKHRDRVWPNRKQFVIVKGEFYDVRSDYRGDWFGPAIKVKSPSDDTALD